jgi:hypothetical protein
MKNLSILLIIGIMFSGCSISAIPYNGAINKSLENKQYIEHQECTYMFGPFDITNEVTIDKLVNNTIKKANEQGMYGDSLVNVDISEGGYSTIIFSKMCLYLKGNLVNTK